METTVGQKSHWSEEDNLCCPSAVVHNLFLSRATSRLLKLFGGLTSETIMPVSDKRMPKLRMTCAVKHRVNIKSYRERDSKYFCITILLVLQLSPFHTEPEVVHTS